MAPGQSSPLSRTSPTVNSPGSGGFSRRAERPRWSLRLGLPHVVALGGLVSGSILSAYYLGLTSGQMVGFEGAMAKVAATTPRLPIAEEHLTAGALVGPEDQGEFDVYAKLRDRVGAPRNEVGDSGTSASLAKGTSHDTGSAPALGAIEPLTQGSLAPVVEEVLARQGSDLKETRNLGESLDDLIPQSDLGAVKVGTKTQEKPQTLAGLVVAESQKNPSKGMNDSRSVVARQVGPVSEIAKKEPLAKPARKEPAPPKVSTKTDSFMRAVISKGWYAQIAAPKKLQDASELAQKLKASGFPVVIETARVRGEEYFRVIVGPETARPQAEAMVKQLGRERYLPGTPFLRVVR